MSNEITEFEQWDELVEKLDEVLKNYNLEIKSLVGQLKHPLEIDVYIEEKE